MSPLRFSIITVCYNSRDALPATVQSLADQTYPHREWVVVDGGSRDGTQDFVRHQAPEPVGPFISEKDQGIYDAMNKAIRLATGDVLFFLNADDALYDPHVLADVAAIFEAHPSLALLYGGVVMCQPGQYTEAQYRHVTSWTLPFEGLCHQGVFARRQAFERVGHFNLTWPTSADYDWFLRVFRAGLPTRCTSRLIAWFKDGGAHVQDPQALQRERMTLRRQYLSPAALSIGTFLSRAIHKGTKISRGGYSLGERPLPVGAPPCPLFPLPLTAPLHVDVCIATYRRPLLLGQLLASLQAQVLPPGSHIRWLITDNDPAQSAAPVVQAAQDQGWPAHYFHQPEKNISLTRNVSVAHAQAPLIAFIDDDERASPHWLAQLVHTLHTAQADIVLGPVQGILPPDAPQWLRRGRFFEGEIRRTADTVPQGNTGNALLKRDRIPDLTQAFDPALGLTGGEDAAFFAQLTERGARMVWCHEAFVTEDIPPMRANARWLLQRDFRAGQTYADIRGRPQAFYRIPLWMAYRTGLLLLATVLTLSTWPWSRHRGVQWARKMASNLGQLSTLLKGRFQEYKQVPPLR